MIANPKYDMQTRVSELSMGMHSNWVSVRIVSRSIWDDSSYHANVFLHIWWVSDLFNGAAKQLREKRVTYTIYNTWPESN